MPRCYSFVQLEIGFSIGVLEVEGVARSRIVTGNGEEWTKPDWNRRQNHFRITIEWRWRCLKRSAGSIENDRTASVLRVVTPWLLLNVVKEMEQTRIWESMFGVMWRDLGAIDLGEKTQRPPVANRPDEAGRDIWKPPNGKCRAEALP